MKVGQKTRVGAIGGGQLAWMMALEAQALGIELIVQTPKSSDPAVSRASEVIFGAIADAGATEQLAQRCEAITFENEFIDLDALFPLEKSGVCFRPSLSALQPLLDKYDQRSFLRDLGLPVPSFQNLDWHQIPENLHFPLVLKTRRQGYDGQGTLILKDWDQFHQAAKTFADVSVLLEEFVPFERELAVMAARFSSGEVVVYPVVETKQRNQVCHWVLVPAQVEEKVRQKVEEIAHTLLNKLDVIGIFGIEFFLTTEYQVLVNEIAPRTHNSGHFSLDACQTSQFAQHLRSVADLPVGDPSLKSAGAVMVNLLGYEDSESEYIEKREALAQIPGSHVHWYCKPEVRPGRKLGHVTVCTDSTEREALVAIAEKIESIWYPG
ncbi:MULTISPECIES: 5-(carboxyamino)imidazole ribonucleotide synthase [unclassified Roseofilum]|uniref:5-(carboxyamino)imidazole ribonucleotide synthase n=1 Tax=unclassified Roseofilum TaxID=2620099 RepID=UPI001B2B8882|nr:MULTISPECIES: 5-(carboxyamino)imidazole ribonucleotide synthase [unclassified Roseofilum]MBP0010468.1 5-(carboxyamino)imidazole ribonucleotide synthase [Roseofilum sp. Belize Diploria]MBP0035679.1 5-(carboxyamino)imidazole ribonucleotide synthase [Roseofilum sp. Belize BBD 4]